jgi:hypothetical protein
MYGLMCLGVIVGLFEARRRTLAQLESPHARQAWQAWKAEAQRQSGPVARRIPQSNEPPALVLMRDHFGAVLMVSLVIGSFLFGFLAFLLRGVMAQSGSQVGSQVGR